MSIDKGNPSVYKRVHTYLTRDGALGDFHPDSEKYLCDEQTEEEKVVALVDYAMSFSPKPFRSYAVEWVSTTSFDSRYCLAKEWTAGDNSGTPLSPDEEEDSHNW